MKTFQTTVQKDYVLGWTFTDAIRELIQNAIDKGDWYLTINPNDLNILNQNAALSEESLYLGMTTKSGNSDAIGQFGEGYKLACLVLIRAGYEVSIFTGTQKWTPVIEQSRHHATIEVLAFKIEELPQPAEGRAIESSVHFIVEGLTQEDEASVESVYLTTEAHINSVLTESGRILLDRQYKGKIFVSGLYVTTNKDLHYGYDIPAKYLPLERDRNTVDDFSIQWLLKDIWLAASQHYVEVGNSTILDIAVDLIFDSAADTRYIEHGAHSTHPLVDAVYTMFKLKYGEDAVVASSQTEADSFAWSSIKTVVVYGGLKNILGYASGYSAKVPEPRFGPTQELLHFYKQNKKYMKRAAQADLKELITKSHQWRSK